MSISISKLSLNGRVLLAPMSGVTDHPFRQCVAKLGAVMTVSEMVACDALAHMRPDMVRRAHGKGLTPFIMQLAGRDAHWLARGAELAEAAGADMIDINMGCPARRVTGGASGAALMRDEKHAATLISAVINATTKPVSVKMRLGWDDTHKNAPILARIAEDLGVQMLTIHGRTRCQFYKGKADHYAINAVRAACTLPLIANGDICDGKTAKHARAQSGADGVMIGRAAIGQPWLPAQIATYLQTGKQPRPPSAQQQNKIMQDWYDATIAFYGETLGVRVARKHLAGFIDYFVDDKNMAKTIRAHICRLDEAAAVRDAMATLYQTKPQERAA